MKEIKRALLAVLVAAALLLLPQMAGAAAAGGSGTPTITLNLKSGGTLRRRTITRGVSLQIIARRESGRLASSSLRYRSSDPAVVEVSATGVLQTVRNGNADITVTTRDGRWKAVLRLTVSGQRIRLTPPAEDSGGTEIAGDGSGTLKKPGRQQVIWM